MARFYGEIGYLITSEKIINGERTGIFEEQLIPRFYYGDIIRNVSRWDSSGSLNDDISINNNISIVADPFAVANFQHIKYVKWLDTKWKVTSVEVQYPRLILSMGGVYNE